tara:strand:+ start:2360 stop:2806 length:447 start_codon:yes stop_codon:yes gene_type:complete
MKTVIQRVSSASVNVNNKIINEINDGMLILLGIEKKDNETDVNYLINKIIHLRIFNDDDDNMNLSIIDVLGSILLISQFTLCADTTRGRRPSFFNAAEPILAKKLYNQFYNNLIKYDICVKTGVFGETMNIKLTNSGPVTILLDSNNE